MDDERAQAILKQAMREATEAAGRLGGGAGGALGGRLGARMVERSAKFRVHELFAPASPGDGHPLALAAAILSGRGLIVEQLDHEVSALVGAGPGRLVPALVTVSPARTPDGRSALLVRGVSYAGGLVNQHLERKAAEEIHALLTGAAASTG
jgi:hypothetical protein